MTASDRTGSTPTLAIDTLMSAFLSSVSFETGRRPDYDAIRPLFIDRGLLIKNIAGATETASVDEFIAPRRALVDSGALTQFHETEQEATTSVFGTVAHRLSVYAKSGVQHGAAFAARGIIMTQFAETAGIWRITSMTWDDERPGLSLDDCYQV